jgi:hypothetical protein
MLCNHRVEVGLFFLGLASFIAAPSVEGMELRQWSLL